MKTVIQYPGSKWKLASKIIQLFPEHHTYIEPYFGSGAVFFNKDPSRIEMINDLDCNVINVFKCIQEDSETLARLLMTVPYSRQIYDEAFEINTRESKDDPFVKAAIFLTQCWQGHGFRTNGHKVGWKNDVQGRERMYALWNWYRLPDWVVSTAERLRQVQIENKPALNMLHRFNYEKVLAYIDPPYMLETRTAKQYKHEMNNDDHVELLEFCIKSKMKIIISGYESDLYAEYLKDWNKHCFNALAEHGKKRLEVVWTNYN